jgi:hypothetical protein
MLGEAIDHREDDRLAMDLRQALNEVHQDVRPHLGRHIKGLQQASRLKCLYLVALARAAGTNIILYQGAVAWDEKITPEALQCLLDAFMTGRVRQSNSMMA